MRTSRFRIIFPLLLSFLLLFVASTGFAQARAQIQVDVIVASNDGEGVDPALRAEAQRLTSQFSNFSSFKLAKTERVTLAQGVTNAVSLPGSSVARFTLQGFQNDRYQIQIAVPGGQTTFDARKGGMIFVGGPRAPNGTLILLIRVK